MTTLVFGNTAPVHEGPEAGTEQMTTVVFPDGLSTVQQLTVLTAQDGVVNNHTSEAPSWVASDDDGLAGLIASHYGCPKKPWPLSDEPTLPDATPEPVAVAVETPGVVA